ncbi:uncharacterized protein P174DRAFT_464602 [Aspergillus novofumigatus IBT 16806]|uniref:Alpha-1,3-glucanase/mutanase n=1 Tax=Aspergillus novofumigatus (strain IBT 16806) TaxID=1392255 RepID=A0A2I1BTW9_ASPN1|nr:uncharacterized protein P174DRAFT_464602 [Aspergillus novofumigatus IBT 16806]PKX88853.1 hypothetical protein P174DRAFT_464602 [Aspergillus novofumigatus IBT 16806]
MKLLAALTSALAWGVSLVEAKAVFAHYMVGNTKSLGLIDWRHKMQAAQAAGIDAFVLNMANKDPTNDIALPMAFTAADDIGFQLLFSFDYAGNGPWDKSVVIDMIKGYSTKDTYFKMAGKPFVSTFEGPNNADDWKDIKKETNCFFMPDWSSVSAQPADAWPKGPANMTTYPNTLYYDFLGSKPYMMPISPCNDMWFQCWQQAISLNRQPDFIKIISWNDYGESHYISPLDDCQYEAFDIGRAPFNYIKDMPHNGWRETLPYYISMYKSGTATVTEERLVAWYQVNKNGACSDGGTTSNTANQLVFYDVLLTSNAQVQVSISGVVQAGGWDQEPHGALVFTTAAGQVVVMVKRGGATIATIMGASITSSCNGGLNNYSPWVGSARGPPITPVMTTGDLSKLDCVKGFGVLEFIGVCDFACANGYCPSAACTCLKKGVANAPNDTGLVGYLLPRKSGSFAGLYSFDCNHGYCLDLVCGQTPNDGGLCDFRCHLGFCPIHACTCTSTGILVQTPPKMNDKYPTVTLDPACAPPCVLVLPPSSLASLTTISFDPWQTSLEFGWMTMDMVDGTVTTYYTAVTVSTEISILLVTTDLISFSEVILTTTVDGGVPSIIIPMASVSPPPFVITPTPVADITVAPVAQTICLPPWPWSGPSAMPDPSGTSMTTSTSDPVVVPIVTGPFPATVFPMEIVSWVRDWLPEPTAIQVDGGDPVPVIPCWVWFICGIVLPGFKNLGIYPKGGPPPVGPNPPLGLTLKIPWPQIIIGPDRKPTYPDKPDPEEDSCETATASVCTTTLSYGIVAKRAAEGAAPTWAPQIPFEDDITMMTVIATTATAIPCVVIPRDPRNIDGIRTTLQQQLGGSVLDLFKSRMDQLGTMFFFVPAFTSDQTDAIWATRSEIVERNSPDNMVSLSWPPDIGPVPVQGDYRFDSSAGEGTYVYHVDFGAQPSHPEFSNMFGWMENDPKWHGSLCLSKEVGKTVGIVCKATVVATAWDFQKSINEHWLDALAKVHANISTGARGPRKMALLIQEIIKLGAVFVMGSGNSLGSPNGYLVLFRDPANPNHIPELIVIGSVLGQGILGQHANADWVTCYAPGYVTGLAAYFCGLNSTLTTAASVKERILRLTYCWQLQPNHPEGPYQRYINNVGRSIVPKCSDFSKAKRQSSGGSCPVLTCAGAGCGSSCAGFFCPGTLLKQNLDFLDPPNLDSVQNLDSRYYKDWDGTITCTTTTPTKTIPTTTPTPPKSLSVPIGGPCRLTDECEDNCPKPGAVQCESGVCTCLAPPPKTTPPHAAMCYDVQQCLNVYTCASGDTMVCEPTDYSNGNGLCQCIKGNPS